MLVVRTDENKEVEFDASSIYTTFYVAAFMARNLFTVIVFAVGLNSAIRVGHPSFYKPAKWLQAV